MPSRMASTDQSAPGLCQPFRLNVPNGPRSTLYQWKKLKISNATPLTAVVISPGVNFLRSTNPPSLSSSVPRSRGTRGLAHHGDSTIARTLDRAAKGPFPLRALGYLQHVRRIGVLASGSGTILRAMLDAGLPIAVVLVDRSCGAVAVAESSGVPVEVIARGSFGADFDRVAYTHEVVDVLGRHEIDLIAMAGFGTILEKPIHDAYPDLIVNTHPALLPAFKGWHAVDDAIAAGVKVTGCTVHIARLEVDEGPILAQESVPVHDDDTVETLHERIKEVERRIYPQVLRSLTEES